MISKEELEYWILDLESEPHLSLKEEKYLAIMRELQNLRDQISSGELHS